MKCILAIVTLLLSWLLHDNSQGKEMCTISEKAAIENTVPSLPSDSDDGKLFLSAANNCRYTGENRTSNSTIRSYSNGRRMQSTFRFTSRIIKDGKIVDKNNCFSFIKLRLSRPSGKTCLNRFIYSIHYLLI